MAMTVGQRICPALLAAKLMGELWRTKHFLFTVALFLTGKHGRSKAQTAGCRSCLAAVPRCSGPLRWNSA